MLKEAGFHIDLRDITAVAASGKCQFGGFKGPWGFSRKYSSELK